MQQFCSTVARPFSQPTHKSFHLKTVPILALGTRIAEHEVTRFPVTKILWMVSDSVECPRTEYGPYFTRAEAELAARRFGVRFLLLYKSEIRQDLDMRDERISAIQISPNPNKAAFHTVCATCGLAAHHHYHWQAEVWADIHEFEHSRHFVRLLVKTDDAGLLEVPNWRDGD